MSYNHRLLYTLYYIFCILSIYYYIFLYLIIYFIYTVLCSEYEKGFFLII
nr:MAG TPA: hypothetical protein [Caudoviricetes sp.]